MRRHHAAPLLSLAASSLLFVASASAELIGAFDVTAPTSASMVQGNETDATDNWLNVVNAPVSVNDAFSGPGIADDGIANFASDWIFQIDFAGGVVNEVGNDLVIFDAAFDLGSYAVSTDLDGFAAEVSVIATSFVDTGEDRDFVFAPSAPGTVFANVRAGGFDLSDLGVGPGGSITSIRIRTLNASAADLLGVGAFNVPEPGVAWLAGVAALTLRRLRKREPRGL